ncbi:carbohydrate esterase family 9 protein, partial [Polyporus arcularius HHB13444]
VRDCLLSQEDDTLVEKGIGIDERRGVISTRRAPSSQGRLDRVIDLGGNILSSEVRAATRNVIPSPGFIDNHINGANTLDFSVHEGDDETFRTVHVAEPAALAENCTLHRELLAAIVVSI